MKKITIVWTIILIVIVAGLTFIGFKIKSENKDNVLEKALITQSEKYFGLYMSKYPKLNESVRITYEELKEEGYDAELGLNCTGYVVVENKNGVYDYKAYVSCPNYTTEGYSEE